MFLELSKENPVLLCIASYDTLPMSTAVALGSRSSSLLIRTAHTIRELFASDVAMNCNVEFSPASPLLSLETVVKKVWYFRGSPRAYVSFTNHKISPFRTEQLNVTVSLAGQVLSTGTTSKTGKNEV